MVEESDDVVIKLIETPDNYNKQIEMIRCILEDVKKRGEKHYKQFGRYKNINTFTTSLINSLNALSVCFMVLTFTPISLLF